MNIVINGQAEVVPEPLSLAALVAHLDLTDKRIAVEVNEALVPRSEHASHMLRSGDRVEIVQAIGGG